MVDIDSHNYLGDAYTAYLACASGCLSVSCWVMRKVICVRMSVGRPCLSVSLSVCLFVVCMSHCVSERGHFMATCGVFTCVEQRDPFDVELRGSLPSVYYIAIASNDDNSIIGERSEQT